MCEGLLLATLGSFNYFFILSPSFGQFHSPALDPNWPFPQLETAPAQGTHVSVDLKSVTCGWNNGKPHVWRGRRKIQWFLFYYGDIDQKCLANWPKITNFAWNSWKNDAKTTLFILFFNFGLPKEKNQFRSERKNFAQFCQFCFRSHGTNYFAV